MKRLILILLVSGSVFAQDYGYIKFDAGQAWIIEINDTLITSGNVLKINSGTYGFSARPQISYSWPSIYIENKIEIETADTTFIQLSTDKSKAGNFYINSDLPKTTSYKDLDYRPEQNQYPKLKTGLLLTSIAANWLAFYLKREADSNYGKYKRASNISDIDKFYNLAGDLDNASNIMLTISAAALTGYIYIALTE